MEKNQEEKFDVCVDIYDPITWDSLDVKSRDLLILNGPKRDLSIVKGPRDKLSRCFSSNYYTRYMSNGEKHDRPWLVYSKDLDRIFCFCCKLFKKHSHKENRLINEGFNDWIHAPVRLKEHENSAEHVSNMCIWNDLRDRLETKKTIDKDVQEHIKKEKKYWKELLQRIIYVVEYLAKNTLAFRGTKDRPFDDNNGYFRINRDDC